MDIETYEKLLADIRRELDENERDLKRTAERYDDLMVERRRLMAGFQGITDEIERLKGED